MNCHRVNSILDSGRIDELEGAEKAAIDGHFESCPACRNSWVAFVNIAGVEIPPMSSELHSKIARDIAVRLSPHAKRAHRAIIAGGFLVIGAAAAAIALRGADRELVHAVTTNHASQVPVSTRPMGEAEVSASETPIAESAAVTVDLSWDGSAPAASVNLLDSRSLVVIVDDETDDAEAQAVLDRCHQRAVDRLRAVDGLNVIAGSPVLAYGGSGLSYAEIARALGAGAYVEVGSLGRCQVTLFDAEAGVFLAGHVADASLVIEGSGRPPGIEYDSDGIPLDFYDHLAEHVSDKLLSDEATLMLQAQARFLDTSLSETERLASLSRTSIGNSYYNVDVVNTAVIAGLGQIMTSSTDVQNRRTAVLKFNGVSDSAVVDPLIHVLNYDDVPGIRAAAASVLHDFVDEPRVRDALSRVVAADPDDDASIICCDFTPAQAARRALLSDEGLRNAITAQLMNSSLGDMQRLLPLVSAPDGRGRGAMLEPGEAAAVFGIGSLAEEPTVRERAWSVLYSQTAPNPDFVPTLLDDLENHPGDEVRQAAASGLTPYVDDPAVRASFERVLAADPCECVRTKVTRALDRVSAAVP